MFVLLIISVTGIVLNKISTNINMGNTETLIATIAPKNVSEQAVSWPSSDEAIAMVDSNGTVTGVQELLQ